ncbi:hypothetical protein HK102_001595 [Quaeritorhiza haematococci]|nr:hypothetical protein HK102_001595 [Quaeritorhiza haematococci]
MSENNHDVINLGILGAANIAPRAVLEPLKTDSSTFHIRIHSIAARNPTRAQTFASEHNIPNTHPTYSSLLADPNINAVYIPLPNGLHFEWIMKSIEAGKHVLCEKPFVSNSEQAREVVDLLTKVNAERAKEGKGPLVVVEGFHWRFHPASARIREIISSGILGKLVWTEAKLLIPVGRIAEDDIRRKYELAGGALMDAGCYAVDASRMLSGDLKPRVVSARATRQSNDPRVDQAIHAELEYPNNGPKSIIASDFESSSRIAKLRAVGEKGTLEMDNFISPHVFHKLKIGTNPIDPLSAAPAAPAEETDAASTWLEKVYKDVVEEEHYVDSEGRKATTFWYQLRAFEQVIRGELKEEDYFSVGLTSLASSLAQMEVLDEIYKAAGMDIRQ